tara:strand:- start:1106 stop:1984 length:879 start_codon:yes stop_codon:yes gene_type:complete
MNWVKLLKFLWRIKQPTQDGEHFSRLLDSKIKGSQAASFVNKVVELQKAIILFTGGNVGAVRDPSLFDPKMATKSFFKIWDQTRTGEPMLPFKAPKLIGNQLIEKPTQKDYQNSKDILDVLANGDLSETSIFASDRAKKDTIYRMIHLDWKQALDLLNPQTTEGDLGIPVSTSFFRGSASSFRSEKLDRVNVLFAIKHNNRGSYINVFSVFDHEHEVLSGGRYKINNFTISYDLGSTKQRYDRQKVFDKLVKFHYQSKIHLNQAGFHKRNKDLFPNITSMDVLLFIVECELI